MRSGRPVSLRYTAWDGRRSERTLRPYGIVAHSGQVSSRLPAGLAKVRELPAGQDRPFVIDRPGALRGHVRALASRLTACADAATGNG